jgi:hypothetical protein
MVVFGVLATSIRTGWKVHLTLVPATHAAESSAPEPLVTSQR